MSASLFMNGYFSNVGRDALNYEVLSMQLDGERLKIEGWATMPYTQHFNGRNTHEYELELKSRNHTFTVGGVITGYDLTDQMSYTNNPRCPSNTINSKTCDFDHKNVGFEFSIPLKFLNINEDYKLYLKMHAKQSNKRYKIPLFYATKNNIHLEQGRKEYIIESDFKYARFSVFGHTLIARKGPSPKSDMIYNGDSCSTTYKNSWFFRQNANFNNILDVQMYENFITYFKVKAEPNGCVNQRLRVVESSSNNAKFVYVPSTHVNYLGNPTTIRVREKISIPRVLARNIELDQYQKYDPLNYATASDQFDGNITSKIKVTSSNVNMDVPGTYHTCYMATNSTGYSGSACGRVIVNKLPTKRRFVSRFTIHDTELKTWDRKNLKSRLYEEQSMKQVTLYPK